jgi:hypothetical protein
VGTVLALAEAADAPRRSAQKGGFLAVTGVVEQALEEDAKLFQKDSDAVVEAAYHELGEEGSVDEVGYDCR